MVFLWIASKIRACYNKDTESLHAAKGFSAENIRKYGSAFRGKEVLTS